MIPTFATRREVSLMGESWTEALAITPEDVAALWAKPSEDWPAETLRSLNAATRRGASGRADTTHHYTGGRPRGPAPPEPSNPITATERKIPLMRRPCIEPRCPNTTARTRCTEHERQRARRRNSDPRRLAMYDAAWDRHSRERRAEQPWCEVCGTSVGLSVDHPSDAVWCRSCHSKVEAKRRAASG